MANGNNEQELPRYDQHIVTTSDGSHSVYVPELNEHYHSVHGALQESKHIFIKAGFDNTGKNPLLILEAGFGTGLNALLTAIAARENKRHVSYTTIEKYPLSEKIVKQLNYPDFAGKGARTLFTALHEAEWGKAVSINDWFTIHKICADITMFSPSTVYDLVYFDAFGPDKQPEVWSDLVISRFAGALASGGVFVTYSVKGDLKRKLKACNMIVGLLPGPPGKRQIMRAVKK